MATERIGEQSSLSMDEFQQLSTDARPTGCASGSRLLELDTGKIWTYSAANINPATGDPWWEV